MQDNNNLDDKARVIQKVLNGLGWNTDIGSLVNRIKQIDNGLVQEDEFIYLLNWFGKCSLIHKLDQSLISLPAKNHYTIPDLLAIFNIDGKKTPFLIEIKTSKEDKLSWKEQYYQGLLNYSETVGIPILIAWKWRSFDIWTLFEIKHFQKAVSNFKIGFEKAHKENLMSKMAGDYFIIPYDELAVHFKYKKEKLVQKKEKEAIWETVCESIYITGNENKEITEFDNEIISYLFSLPMEDSVLETDTHIIQTLTPYPNKSAFAQSIPIQLSKAFSNEEINWLTKIKEQNFPVTYQKFLDSLTENIDKGVIRNLLFLLPNSEKENL